MGDQCQPRLWLCCLQAPCITPTQSSGRGPHASTANTSPLVPRTLLPQLKGPAKPMTAADLIEAESPGAESTAGDPVSTLAGHMTRQKWHCSSVLYHAPM